MVNPPLPLKFGAGVNFNPAPPCATVMKSPFAIWVVPSFLNNVPFEIPVILKCVTSTPSTAFLVITRPLADCVSSFVDAPVTDGVSATALTVVERVAVTAAIGVMPPLLVVFTKTRTSLPAVVERCLGLIPAAMLAALVAKDALTIAQDITLDARTVGVAVAVLAAWRRAPLIVVIVAAAVATALVRAV